MTQKPNLNDVKTRIQYMLDGGKVTTPLASIGSYYFFDGQFKFFNAASRKAEEATTSLLFRLHSDWEPYEEPKTEEDLRKEFREAYVETCRHGRFSDEADFLFDTFELRKKS